MNAKPKYLLISEGRRAEHTDLSEIMKLAKNVTDYYEIFKCYTSGMKEEKEIFTSREVDLIVSMKSRGHSILAIMRRMKMKKSVVEKILFQEY